MSYTPEIRIFCTFYEAFSLDIVFYIIHKLGTPILYILHLCRIFMATCMQDEALISAEINFKKKFPKWKMSINYCEYS